MGTQTVRVDGLRELLRATDNAGKETKKIVRDRFRQIAEPVRADASSLFQDVSPKSAARYGISVRKAGTISVEQRLRRTSGKRPDFGALQMSRALGPALERNTDEVEREFGDALDDLLRKWGRGG